jgi:predicted secreted protein
MPNRSSRKLARRAADIAVGAGLGGVLLLIYSCDFLVHPVGPKAGPVIIDEPLVSQVNEPQFKVAIQDEPDEDSGVKPVARYKIEDELEERFGPQATGPVKVEIKDDPAESGNQGVGVDKAPRVKYALGTPFGTLPAPEFRDNPIGPRVATQRPNKGVLSAGAAPLSFGIRATDAAGAAKNKLLTWSPTGSSNMTTVRLNGTLAPLGGVRGRMVRTGQAGLAEGIAATPDGVSASQSTWVVGGDSAGNGGLRFHQVLEVVPGQVQSSGRRLLDTVLIRFVIDNRGAKAQKVGLRVIIDTLIGSNDGVPFMVPDRPSLVQTWADFRRPQDVPDFVQAFEFPSLRSPGTIAHLTTKVGGKIEPPSRLSLTFQQYWAIPFDAVRNWDYPVTNMLDDSAVVLYWSDKDIKPGETRVLGFAYGLGSVTDSDPGGTLAVTLGGNFDIGQSFTITAYVNKPVAGQTLTLELPSGLERIKGESTQVVTAPTVGNTSIVSWEAKVLQTGVFPLKVRSSTGITQTKTLTIAQGSGPIGGKLSIDLQGSFEPGQTFTVLGKVNEPLDNQTLTLHLPAGLQNVDGQATQRVPAPPAGSKDSVVQWKVRVEQPGKYPVRVSSSTGVAQTKTITIVQPGRAEGYYQILLSGDFTPGKTFAVSAPVVNPVPEQTLTLLLPNGLKCVEGAETQSVQAGVKVVWKVKVLETGKFSVGVKSTTGLTQRKTVIIDPPADQEGQFNFDIAGDIRPGKEVKINAQVTRPKAGQTLTLFLPNGLQLVNGDATQSVPVPASNGTSTLTWLVRVTQSGRLPVRIESSIGLARTKTITLSESTKTLLGN